MFMDELELLERQQRFAYKRDIPVSGNYSDTSRPGGSPESGERPERANRVSPEYELWRKKMGIDYNKRNSN